jgi:hypothetical protein
MGKQAFEQEPSAWALSKVIHGGYLGGKERYLHYTWRSMLSRCRNPNDKAYRYYGGKGIYVCDRWSSFENFAKDMGERPSPSHSLERVNNALGYCKENCTWATRSEQQKNKSSTKWYTNGTFTGVLVECAAYVGISKELAHWRWGKWGTFEKGVEWQLQKKN